MTELTDRGDLEKATANAVAMTLAKYQARLMDLLGDSPDPESVPDSFWEEMGAELVQDIKPKLEQAYTQSSFALGQDATNRYQIEIARTVDWNLVNQAAANWAKDYTFELVKGINDTTQHLISEGVKEFFENQGTIGDLRNLLAEEAFSPLRASLIATTEVTRANVQGELSIVNWIEEDGGPKMIPTFQTSEDDHVCDICGPLDGQVIDNPDDFPPLHPDCRCWINWSPEGWE